MIKKTTFLIAVMLFVLVWGAFGLLAGPALSGHALQATPAATSPVGVTVIAPVVTQLVPVTGNNDQTGVMFWVFVGLIGLIVVVLLAALLANSGARREGPPPPP